MTYPLAWSLIHFLWEGAVIAIVLRLLLVAARRAQTRYALACAALASMPLALVVTWWVSTPAKARVILLNPLDLGNGPIVTGAAPAALPVSLLHAILPWVAPIWMAGVAAFYLRTVASWTLSRRLRRTGVCAVAPEWRQRLAGLCGTLRLSRPVELLESCLVDVPVVMGFVRPVILMPVGILTGLSTSQVESILIHELAHIRRVDYLVNLLQNVVEGLLFYHPAVWWVSKQVRAEREHCCDDVVVAMKGDAREYAATLVTLENNRWPVHEAALAATGGNLMKRIHRLLEKPDLHRGSAAPVFVLALLLVSLGVAIAQRPAQTAPLQVAQVQPPQPSAEPQTPYRKWLTEDVAYIIRDEERTAFKRLTTDEEREKFIEQFWLHRDPTPGTPANEMRDEHYRRIAYANQHWSTSIPGWKTDRGRIYITYGPPDEIEAHPNGDASSAAPYERWRYRLIEGIGENVVVEFADAGRTGDYRMTSDPSVPRAAQVKAGTIIQEVGATGAGTRLMMITVPLEKYDGHSVNLLCTIQTATGRGVQMFETTRSPAPQMFAQAITLRPGSYRLTIHIKDTVTGGRASDEIPFEVN